MEYSVWTAMHHSELRTVTDYTSSVSSEFPQLCGCRLAGFGERFTKAVLHDLNLALYAHWDVRLAYAARHAHCAGDCSSMSILSSIFSASSTF